MQAIFLIVYSLWAGGKISGLGSKLNCAARVGSDDLGYGPGSGFPLKPVQTSTTYSFNYSTFNSVLKKWPNIKD